MTKSEMIDEIIETLQWLSDRAKPDESGTPIDFTDFHAAVLSTSESGHTA